MKLRVEPETDSRRSRGEATRRSLMRAAEKLIAKHGIENVTIRDILTAAGQKNTSALQYHFGNLQGLVMALRRSRNNEVKTRRTALIKQTLTENPTPSLRDICRLMVAPAFELAQSDPGFRRYVKAFGQEIVLADTSALTLVNQTGGESVERIGLLLRQSLSQLDDEAYERRVDGALRFISAAMVHHARGKNAFKGAAAEVFFSSLIDAAVGLLSAPESEETRALRA